MSNTTQTPGAVEQTFALGSQWPTIDPFLFVAYHRDNYPKANASFGPAEGTDGRNIGADFAGLDGWNMYHGTVVPGFPQHPHRGFETITFTRHGLIDHADSLGAAARYGNGDVQWMTAGGGIVHSEMFPLLDTTADNPVELFQIWLNLPRERKMVDPAFKMLWSETIPKHTIVDHEGRSVTVTVVAGSLRNAMPDIAEPDTPTPHSWAADPSNDVSIWHFELDAGAKIELPAVGHPDTRRTVYVLDGAGATVGSDQVGSQTGAVLATGDAVEIQAGELPTTVVVLGGRPIAEPVAQHGPFVMNDRAGVEQAFRDYQQTQFGGWSWDRVDQVHGGDPKRFAKYPDGRVDEPPAAH